MVYKQDIRVRNFIHLLVFFLFIGSLFTGIRLAFDNPYMPEQLLHNLLIPQGNVFFWHEIFAYFWLSITCYVLINRQKFTYLKKSSSHKKHIKT